MTKLIHLAVCSIVLAFLSGESFAYSAIAMVDGQAKETFHSAYDFDTQKAADRRALEGCQESARRSGYPNLAKKCVVVTRGKGPGYGAATCGDGGCAWTTGYADLQEAVDAAYDRCASTYKSCQSEGITNWEDFAGFRKKSPEKVVVNESCRPHSTRVVCQSRCANGDCILTYENGCKIHVTVQPNFNSFTNQWEYPAPSC